MPENSQPPRDKCGEVSHGAHVAGLRLGFELAQTHVVEHALAKGKTAWVDAVMILLLLNNEPIASPLNIDRGIAFATSTTFAAGYRGSGSVHGLPFERRSQDWIP